MVNKNHLDQDCRQRAKEVLLKKHRHQGNPRSSKKSKSGMSSFGSFAKKASSAGLSDLLKRSDSTPKTTALAPPKLEEVNEKGQDGDFPHLPSAVDLVGKQKESDARDEIPRSDSDVCVEVNGYIIKIIIFILLSKS